MGVNIKKNMKKILSIILVSLLFSPLFVFADWCTDAGGMFCNNGSHMNCYCPDGSVLAGSSCDTQGSFSCSSIGVSNPGESDDDDDTTTGGETTTGGGTTTGESTGLTSSTGGITNPISANTFAELVELVTKWIIDIALVLAPLIIVYGGFTYITAAGEPAKMEMGKKIILYAVIGFILVLLAVSLVGVLTDLAK